MVLELITIGFRVWGLGFRVWGLGFRVQGSGFRVWGLGFRVQGVSGEVARSGVKHPGPRARVAYKPTPATQTILY